jgi:tRNA1Val (adenine37-N6)-methyltransferase
MSNTYFQFKQFRIDQSDCAMKVTTEGCILGACAHALNPERILDIGAGTGVLSLMLAQRYNCAIDAVEIDKLAANQALVNFSSSPWNERLNLHYQEVTAFTSGSDIQYDLIISNPPFFNSNLKSESRAKNLAIHDPSLPQDMLLQAISNLISDVGIAFVLYPEYEANQFLNLIEQVGINGQVSLIIKNKPNGAVFRKMIELSKSDLSKPDFPQELNIRNEDNEFSNEYIELLKPYYLHL